MMKCIHVEDNRRGGKKLKTIKLKMQKTKILCKMCDMAEKQKTEK